jgi:ADP-ribosylglycohydrolase
MTDPAPAAAPTRPEGRALAALQGLALGDAMGMPSQTLDRDRIAAAYGRIAGLVAPMAGHPVSHGLGAGQVTDDTEQAILLARRLIADAPGFDTGAWARDLLAWEAGVAARGLRDLLGPSTKAALAALQAGVPPDRTGLGGTTNGAAMRIAPLGIATPPEVGRIVARVAQVSRLTHGTGAALAGAAAVAMTVSLGVAGVPLPLALPQALAAARHPAPGAEAAAHGALADRIALALDLAPGGEAVLAARIGTSVQAIQSVPCAFGIVALAGGDPWQAALIAANIGDDTDTIGAMAAAMAASFSGVGSVPEGVMARLDAANDLDLQPLVTGLMRLRAGAS